MTSTPLRIKAQLFAGEERAFGPGRADLLEAIAAQGSISGAGRAMGMSYRRAWLLVDSMNRCFVARLVETSAGGGAGAGARLTPTGERVLRAFRELQADLERAGEGEAARAIASLLHSNPIP